MTLLQVTNDDDDDDDDDDNNNNNNFALELAIKAQRITGGIALLLP
jgi:hypothetical protein